MGKGVTTTRRAFLGTAAAVPLGLSRSRPAWGPNERIGVGFIGQGGRGSALMAELLPLAEKHNVRVTAVCDVWRKNLEDAARRVKQKLGEEPKRFTRFQDLLAFEGVDAVIIATPDFSHGAILTAALEAGKDVYIEKPMTIDLASANRALDTAVANRRVVQAGTQRRSDGKFRAAAKLLSERAIGPVSRVSAAVYFNEPRWMRDVSDCVEGDVDWKGYLLHLPSRRFDARLLRMWQLYRETSNGMPGLWMTHYADAIHMLTGAKYPSSAVALGGIYAWKDGREHADTFHAVLDYPEGFLFEWGMGLGNGDGTRFTVNGSRGTIDLEKWTVSPAGGRPPGIEARKIEPVAGASHMENWLECLRTRRPTNAPIEAGHQHAVATIMAAKAFETGRRQKYDSVRRVIGAT